MNKQLRLILGCIALVGLASVTGYIYLWPTMLDDRGPSADRSASPAPSLNSIGVAKKADNNPNRYEDGWPVLVVAAYRGDLEEVKELIKAGADVNIKGPNDWTALHQAAGNGHSEMAQALIKAGAFIHAENKSWNNARDLAEERGYREIAQSLYDLGVADHNTREFIMLTILGIEKQASNWLDKEHDPNRVDHKGRSALFYAVCKDWDNRYNDRAFVLRPNIIKLLLENGADPNLMDAKGKTPMIAFITEYGTNEEVFNLMMGHGAKLDVTDFANRSLLHSSKSSSLMPELIELGLDVNQIDAYGLAPLHVHAKAINAPAIELLLKNGADPEATDKDGHKPIDLLLPKREPGSRGYESWNAAYNTLSRVSQPTERPE